MQGFVGGIGHDETKTLFMYRQLASSTNFIRLAYKRVSMGLTVRRKTAKNLAVRRKNERILAVSRKKNKKN